MLFIFITSLAASLHFSRRDQPYKPYIDTGSFYSQQNPIIYAGEIHYSRIPVEYWEHRRLMVKALGLNALSVYIMWNYHEIERGRFDF
jgi:beta-galactosidase